MSISISSYSLWSTADTGKTTPVFGGRLSSRPSRTSFAEMPRWNQPQGVCLLSKVPVLNLSGGCVQQQVIMLDCMCAESFISGRCVTAAER